LVQEINILKKKRFFYLWFRWRRKNKNSGNW